MTNDCTAALISALEGINSAILGLRKPQDAPWLLSHLERKDAEIRSVLYDRKEGDFATFTEATEWLNIHHPGWIIKSPGGPVRLYFQDTKVFVIDDPDAVKNPDALGISIEILKHGLPVRGLRTSHEPTPP